MSKCKNRYFLSQTLDQIERLRKPHNIIIAFGSLDVPAVGIGGNFSGTIAQCHEFLYFLFPLAQGYKDVLVTWCSGSIGEAAAIICVGFRVKGLLS